MRMNRIRIPDRYKKIGKWLLGIFLLLFIVGTSYAFMKREALLKTAIEKAKAKAKDDYNLDVAINQYGFSGISTVKLKGMSVVPVERDSLFKAEELSVKVKLFPLILGDIKLSEVNLQNALFSAVFKDSLSNLDFILKRKKDTTSHSTSEKADLSKIAHDLMNQILYKIPDNMELRNIVFSLNDQDTAGLRFHVNKATIDGGKLNAAIDVNAGEANWLVEGKLRPGRRKLEVSLRSANNQPVQLPYLNNKLNGRFSFDSIFTKMEDAGYEGNDFVISGSWGVKNLKINQQRLTTNDIMVPDATFDAVMFVGPNYLGIDSASAIKINKAVVNPFVKYTLSPYKIYEFKLNVKEQKAEDLLASFPVGLFETLDGMQATGKISYQLAMALDSRVPDSVQFSSRLIPKDFKIIKWGKTDLAFMNREFVYTPYEFGKPMRNIIIGPSNPNFVPISSVSDNFKNAVLTSEDPSFFRHNGFVEDAIRSSIAVNYKAKAFKRGGSTISMQLVKNVFLSRHKALSRKAEEILIVWLIEHNKLVSKQRMFEVYLNIIEMGFNVYGIGEGSRHYFGKHPAELSVGEGIFLASIVPRPKAALYKFSSNGGLKPYMFNYFNFIGNTMSRRGIIEPDSTGYGFYNVRLRDGLHHLLPKDTSTIDSSLLDSEDDFPLLMQDGSKSLFDRFFPAVKRDTVPQKIMVPDTAKTRKEMRQERRQQRRQENN